MAFKDITKVMYDGEIKLDYKDKAHRYYVRTRINWDLPVTDAKAWSKVIYPKGTTTLLGDTLEKKGLMQWPKREALSELFGFYEAFIGDNDKEIPAGYKKGVGSLWDENGKLIAGDKESLLEVVDSASKKWQRRQKKGADIGSVVHDAIEHFIKGMDFDIGENYAWTIKESDYESEALREKAMEEFDEDVVMATNAFLQFQKWWLTVTPTLYGAEDILYSKVYNVCGTYDGDIGIPREHHPVAMQWDKDIIRCVADWKTSKTHKEAPEGVSYDYFIQSAIYEILRREMGFEPADDLVIVSARKDGGFSPIFASELGLTIDECVEWAKNVIFCYRMREKTLLGLKKHAELAEAQEAPLNQNKEDF